MRYIKPLLQLPFQWSGRCRVPKEKSSTWEKPVISVHQPTYIVSGFDCTVFLVAASL